MTGQQSTAHRTLPSVAGEPAGRGRAAYFGSRGFMASSIAWCEPLEAPMSPTWSARPLNSAAWLLSQRIA